MPIQLKWVLPQDLGITPTERNKFTRHVIESIPAYDYSHSHKPSGADGSIGEGVDIGKSRGRAKAATIRLQVIRDFYNYQSF